MYLIAENSCNTWGAQQSLKLALIQGERGEQCHCDSTISLCDYFLSMATNNFIFLNTKCNSDVDNLYLCFKRPIGLMNKQILNKIQQQIIDIYQIQIIVQGVPQICEFELCEFELCEFYLCDFSKGFPKILLMPFSKVNILLMLNLSSKNRCCHQPNSKLQFVL